MNIKAIALIEIKQRTGVLGVYIDIHSKNHLVNGFGLRVLHFHSVL